MALLFLVMLGLALCYAVFIGGFAVGFQRVLRQKQEIAVTPLPFVSVLVPARNEAASIAACVASILANDYPPDCFEVLVIDDLSGDETAAVVRRLQQHYNLVPVLAGGNEEAVDEPGLRLRLLQMPENGHRARAHKKYALEKGVATARGELILATDADSVVPPRWIRTMVSYFAADTAFVSGPVLYDTDHSPFSDMQALEFLGLVAISAGAVGLGRPVLCSGANVAYRKAVFDDLGGYRGIDHLTSGDDELLMQKIAYTTSWTVRYCTNPAAVVWTPPLPSVRAFFEQRRRWASKGAHYPNRSLVVMNVLFYLFFLSLLLGLPAAFFIPELWMPVLCGMGLKGIAELSLLWPACRHFGRTRLLRYFLPAQPLQILYIIMASTAGALGGYTWKGRTIER